MSEDRSITRLVQLGESLNNPTILEKHPENFDSFLRGHCSQAEKKPDTNMDPMLSHHLFQGDRPFGDDLRSMDIQRSRDHGLASYNDAREFCQLKRAENWEDFETEIPHEQVVKLQALYKDIDDVDLSVGASLENHVEGIA